MALTYFGNLTSDDYWGITGGAAYYGIWACPGSGSQTVKELSALVYYSASTNIRLAIYSSDGATLIAQGTAEVLCEQTTATWQGHMAQGDVTPNPVNLTGGTNYILAFSIDATHYARSLTNQGQTLSAPLLHDYTGGFPDALDLEDFGDYYDLCIRCGVEAAGGGVGAIKRFGGVPHVAVNRGVW
jgi:hypothetical protein